MSTVSWLEPIAAYRSDSETESDDSNCTSRTVSPDPNVPTICTMQVKAKVLAAELVPALCTLLANAGRQGKDKVVTEFLLMHPRSASKRQLSSLVDKLAVKEKRAGDRAAVWHVLLVGGGSG